MQEAAFFRCYHNVFDIKASPAHMRKGGFVVSVIERNILSVSKLFIFNKSEHLSGAAKDEHRADSEHIKAMSAAKHSSMRDI